MPTNSNKKASDPTKINSHSTSSKKTQLHHKSTKIVKPACISSGLCLLARSLPFTEDTSVSHRSYRSSAGITEWLRFLPRRQSETCHGIKLSCRLVASNGGGCKDCNWQLGSRVLSINSSVMMASQESDSHMWNWFQKSFSLDFPFLSGQSSKVYTSISSQSSRLDHGWRLKTCQKSTDGSSTPPLHHSWGEMESTVATSETRK